MSSLHMALIVIVIQSVALILVGLTNLEIIG